MQNTIVKLMSASATGWIAMKARFHSTGIAGMKQ